MPSVKQKRGQRAEDLAEAFLDREGYTVIARNWRGAGVEIDRIAWDKDVLCFVEVRMRSRDDYGLPLETVNRRKQSRIVRGAAAFCQARGVTAMVRFDVVSVSVSKETGKPNVAVIKNAFDAGW